MKVNMRVTGDFNKTKNFFRKGKEISPRLRKIFEEHGKQGVEALRNATPKDSGETSDGWKYTIQNWGLVFTNDVENNGVSIAILIQYGHATKSGFYIQGQDYINPALKPVFDDLLSKIEKEVKNL